MWFVESAGENRERATKGEGGNSEFPTRPTCFRYITLKVGVHQYVSMTVLSYGIVELRLWVDLEVDDIQRERESILESSSSRIDGML